MCLEEHRVGCHDGAKGTCLVRWGAEYSEEHWERLLEKVDQHRRREPSSTDPVSVRSHWLVWCRAAVLSVASWP